MNVKAAEIVKPFRFSDRHKEKAGGTIRQKSERAAVRWRYSKIVWLHVSNRDGNKSVGAAAIAMRSNASAVVKAAKQLKKSVGLLDDGEKGLLGQLMWTVDKQRYAPAAFSVDQVAEAAYVLEQAARKLTPGGRGGRTSLQLDALIREVYVAYVVRFGSNPELSLAKGNDFAFALKICLNAAGEQTKTLSQLMRNAINS